MHVFEDCRPSTEAINMTPSVRHVVVGGCPQHRPHGIPSSSAALRASSSSAGGHHCFDILGIFCVDWVVAPNGVDITFNATVKSLIDGLLSPGWMAVGFNMGGSKKMAPAEVLWASRLSSDVVSAEDRINPEGHAPPVCLNPQVSTTNGTLAADGSITASWTRPLAVNTSGYVDLVPGSTYHIIAAWAFKKDLQGKACSGGWPEHKNVYTSSITI